MQLWEKHEGLPVRRHQHRKLGSVFAYRLELERWWISRASAGNGMAVEQGELSSIAAHALKPTPAAIGSTVSVSVSQVAKFCEMRLVALPFEIALVPMERGFGRQSIESFAAGLRDELVVELCRLDVRPTVLLGRGLPGSTGATESYLKALAAELMADTLMTGTVRSANGRVRITIQLLHAANLRCIWSERFEMGLTNLFDAQTSLAVRIAQALPRHAIEAALSAKPEPRPSDSLADVACRMGLHFWGKRTRVGIEKSLGYFKDAIDLDPGHAESYAGLADAYVSLSYNHMLPAREAAIAANQAVQTALRLDNSSVAVRNALINVLTNCRWDWASAERECRSMIDSGQMDSRTTQLYSSMLNSQGRHDDAIDLALHAHRSNSESAAVNGQVALAYFYGRDYASALPFVETALQLAPGFAMGHSMHGRIHAALGNWTESLDAFRRTQELSDNSPFSRALTAYAYAGSGHVPMANSILRDLEREPSDDCFPAYDVSAVYSILGEDRKALESISRACLTRDMKTIYVKQDPRLERLQNYPGFQRIASSMSLS